MATLVHVVVDCCVQAYATEQVVGRFNVLLFFLAPPPTAPPPPRGGGGRVGRAHATIEGPKETTRFTWRRESRRCERGRVRACRSWGEAGGLWKTEPLLRLDYPTYYENILRANLPESSLRYINGAKIILNGVNNENVMWVVKTATTVSYGAGKDALTKVTGDVQKSTFELYQFVLSVVKNMTQTLPSVIQSMSQRLEIVFIALICVCYKLRAKHNRAIP